MSIARAVRSDRGFGVFWLGFGLSVLGDAITRTRERSVRVIGNRGGIQRGDNGRMSAGLTYPPRATVGAEVEASSGRRL